MTFTADQQTANELATFLLASSYNFPESKIGLPQIDAVLLLRDYASQSQKKDFVPGQHDLLARRKSPRGFYDPLTDLAVAPSFDELTRRCRSIARDVNIIGEVVRYLLILRQHNPARASVEGATFLYSSLSEMQNESRSVGTLKRNFRRYRGVSHLCFAVRHLKPDLKRLWLGDLTTSNPHDVDFDIHEFVTISELALRGLRNVSPEKRNANRSNDVWDTTHLRLGDEDPALSPSEFETSMRSLAKEIGASEEEIAQAIAYKS